MLKPEANHQCKQNETDPQNIPKEIKEMEDICPLLCGSRWLPQGYQGLLMIDCALLYSDDRFSGSKLHPLHVAM